MNQSLLKFKDPLLNYYHHIMLANELGAVASPYQLSFAGTINSGLSVGYNQIDLSECDALTFNQLLDFLDPTHQPQLIQKLRSKGHSAKAIFADELPDLEAKLSSHQGRAIIDNLYLMHLKKDALKIDKIVTSLKPKTHCFYNTQLGKGLLFDYNNQFNISATGKLMGYLNSFSPADYSLTDHWFYLKNTKYFKSNPRDLKRRISNILSINELIINLPA